MKAFYDIQKRTDLTWSQKLAVLTYRFLEESQYECPVTHLFEKGWYVREMTIPKGTFFIGRPHVQGHRVDLISGTVLHFEEGHKAVRTAPYSQMTSPGYQTVFLTMTPVVGRTYHPDSGERDLDRLEAELFVPIETVKALGAEISREAA